MPRVVNMLRVHAAKRLQKAGLPLPTTEVEWLREEGVELELQAMRVRDTELPDMRESGKPDSFGGSK